MPLPVIALGTLAVLGKLIAVAVAAGLVMFFADLEAWAWAGVNLIVAGNLDDSISMTGTLPANLGGWFWYASHVTRLWDGLSMLLSAWVIAFLIRRIPLFG